MYITGVRRPPPANEGAGLTGLTWVRRFAERARLQARSMHPMHPIGMQGMHGMQGRAGA